MFITPNLSETFAPPNIATNGLSGVSTASPKNFNSFCIKYPQALSSKNSPAPTVEQWALWAVPKASFTNISASDANSFEKFSSFLVSSFLYLVFWSNITSPSFISAAAFLAFSPTTQSSAANFTSCPNISDNLFATGAKDNSGLASPFGFPKWEQSITLALWSTRYFIVGNAPFNLFSSVITPSFSGTLKSHLTRTLFPATCISSIVFLLSIDIKHFSFYLKYF